VQVRGDLTNAELSIESLAWRKPAGRSAYVQFDVVKGAGRYKTELQNFRVVGDDIVINGVLSLDAQARVREFSFPNFTIGLVSRLEMHGTLRPDNVWEVRANGTTYDGRDFFHSLYGAGQASEKSRPGRKDEPGLDLRADVDTVLGFSDLTWKGLKVQLSKRAGKLTALSARGTVEGAREAGRLLEVSLQQKNGRRLIALSDDAGQVFRLAGFYPNMQGGRLYLEVNLDGRGPAEKTGVIFVEKFNILGDPVVYEVLQAPGEAGGAKPQRRIQREVLPFDWLRTPFSVGYGQVVLDKAELRGQLLGATFRGKLDYQMQAISIGGTYVPLQGLNSFIGNIPGIGQLLAGPQGEGVLGITFAIQGPMARPQVIVNPLALLTPGITRELMQLTTPTPHVTPREAAGSGTGKQGGAITEWSSETLPPDKRK